MKNKSFVNYQRVARAIGYIRENFKKQPSLDEVARNVGLSPDHFQRIFGDWVGVSPKNILKDGKATLMEATYQTGLSGAGRLHDLFVGIEAMTPGEFKNGGENLAINYSYLESQFGMALVAATAKGVCYLGFDDDGAVALGDLKKRFPRANFEEKLDDFQSDVLECLVNDWSDIDKIRLHLKGTDFQLKVWSALLKIPTGRLVSYGDVAKGLENPGAYRAVGTAVGRNPVSLLIPCHRVICSNGELGGYMWGVDRKAAMIAWEAEKFGIKS